MPLGDDAWPSSFAGVGLAAVGGWQLVICGGGLPRCWFSLDESAQLWAQGGLVPAAVSARYFGTLVASEQLFFLGGSDAVTPAPVTKLHCATNERVCRCSDTTW